MADMNRLAELRARQFPGLPLDCGAEAHPGIVDTEEWRDWTERKTTPDQLRIENYLAGFDLSGKRILHVGVGNSGLAQRFAGRVKEIFGTTVVGAEAERGNNLGLSNYRVVVHNKYSKDVSEVPAGFDFIVDNNPSSFCCCLRHLVAALDFYASHLADGGQVLGDRSGLAWAIDANPGWGFGLDDFAQVAALAGLSCYRINYDTFALAREEPLKPPPLWRAAIGLRSLRRRAAGKVSRMAGSLARASA